LGILEIARGDVVLAVLQGEMDKPRPGDAEIKKMCQFAKVDLPQEAFIAGAEGGQLRVMCIADEKASRPDRACPVPIAQATDRL
jgi:hypothetical protein